jgi:DNA-binding transcriptional MerR regulator
MIRIGDFSRLARVSIRALRHYEDEGLLRPVHVDARNGYRYYDASQLTAIHRIKALRDLGVSVREIRELDEGDERAVAELLRTHRAHLEDSIAESSAHLRQLEAMLRRIEAPGDFPPSLVRVRALPAVTALCVRARVATLEAPVTALFEATERAAARDRIDESPFLLLHDESYPDSDIDVEVCVPVAAQARLPGVRVVEAIEQAACVAYGGPYCQTEALYRELLSWLEHSGTSIAGPLREVYHRFGADQRGYRLPSQRLTSNEADYVTELQVPVVRRTS